MQLLLLFLVHCGLQPQTILASIHWNWFSLSVSFLYWRTPNWTQVLQAWSHKCQIEEDNPLPLTR